MPAYVKEHLKDGGFEFACLRCGPFSISADADAELRSHPLKEQSVAVASGFIRQNAGLRIEQTDIARLRNLGPPNVAEKTANILLQLAREFPTPSEGIADPSVMVALALERLREFESNTVFPAEIEKAPGVKWLKWLAISSACDSSELGWLVHEALLGRGYLRELDRHFIVQKHAYKQLVITPPGWDAVERLREKRTDSRIGFVAMSFQPEFNELYEKGISQGIRLAGYQPLRIDRTEHNNRIDDEILASIKRSRFLVADFTSHRGGIYFEAGYALGMGLRVIWLVNSEELKNVHFDTRQYNFIRWQHGEWPALQRALKNRIEVTVGPSPDAK
jgi:hypothetical protein